MPAPIPTTDGFNCPFHYQCWQRELFRWLAIVVVSGLTSWLSGCALRFKTPTLDLTIDGRSIVTTQPVAQSAP
jgi:hypothetical protein